MAKFNWVKDLQRKAQADKQQRQSQLDYTVQPVSSRFGGWSNTGFGTDGINQPNMPAMQLQSARGPVNMHEGEPYRQLPDGSVQVVSQRDLLKDEQTGRAGGMQQGGIIPPRRTPAARQSFQAQPGSPQPIVPNTQPVNITQPQNVSPVNITQPTTPQTQGFDITGAPKPQDPFYQSPGDLQDINITQPKPGLAGRIPLTATGVAPETVIGKIPEPVTETPITEEPPLDKDNFYEQMFKKGMGWVEEMMQGGSPAQKAAYQKYIDDMKATQATERMVGAQQAAQGRLGEQTAAARGLMMQRMHGINLAGMEAAGGIEQMQAQERAAEKLAALGLQGMNFQQAQEQFEFAKDQYEYGKQLDTINALLAEGGEENFKQASMMFQDMYGKDIDFSNSLTQENIGKFNQGWNNLGGLIASGMSWEDAVKVMQQDGTLDLLGLTESDVKSIYEQQQLMNDPLYAQMKMIDNWVDQGIITQDQADNLLAIMNDALTNPEGYDIKAGWVVKDAAGNEVGFFTDETAADEFMKDHPEYSKKFMEKHIGKKTITPEGEPTIPDIPSDIGEGGMFVDGDKIYKNVNGTAQEVEPNLDEPFTSVNDDIVKQLYDSSKSFGEQSGIVKDVLNAQYDMLQSGDKDWSSYLSGKTKNDPLYQKLLNDNSTNNFTLSRTTVGSGSTERHVYDELPNPGGYFKYGGTVFQVKSKRTIDSGGRDEKEYTLINPITGEQFTIDTLHNDETKETLEKYS